MPQTPALIPQQNDALCKTAWRSSGQTDNDRRPDP